MNFAEVFELSEQIGTTRRVMEDAERTVAELAARLVGIERVTAGLQIELSLARELGRQEEALRLEVEIQSLLTQSEDVRQQLEAAQAEAAPHRAALNARVATYENELNWSRVDTSVPLALLPVRLETRYRRLETSGAELLIRIYPDDIHQDTHEPELTSAEMARATDFWTAMSNAGSNRPRQLEAWRRLAEGFGANRAAWIVNRTKGGAQATPKEIDRAWTRAPRTAVLPDRWVALGYSTNEGYSARIFEQWGELIGREGSDLLQTGPDPMQTVAAGEVDDGMRWMVDFEEACKRGMAIRKEFKPDPQNPPPETIPLLLVLGAKATLGRHESAERLRLLMDAHHYTWGLGLVPTGTPTNNTADVTSDYAARDPGYETSFKTELGPELCKANDGSDGDLLARALGVGLFQPHIFGHVQYADRRDQSDAGSMNDVMWPTWRYFLSEMMSGLDISRDRDSVFEQWRQHFVSHVRARGPLAALRVGSQPYGLLPVTSVYSWRVRGNQPEIVTFTIDSSTGSNQGKLRVGWNADPDTNEFDGWGSPQFTPSAHGDRNAGAAIAIADITNSGQLALIILRIDSGTSGDYGYLVVARDISQGGAEDWSAPSPEIPSATSGGFNRAVGIAVIDLNRDGQTEVVVLRVDGRPDGSDHAYLYVGWNLKADGTVSEWGVPIDIMEAFPEPIVTAGLAVADVNGNGLPDVIFAYVTDTSPNRAFLRIGRDLDAEGKVSGGWTEPVPFAPQLGRHTRRIQIAVLDLDSDGKQDDLMLFAVTVVGDELDMGSVWHGHNLTIDGQIGRWSTIGTPLELPEISGGVGLAVADLGPGPFYSLATRVGRINLLKELLASWRRALPEVPRVGKSSDPDADLVEVLGLAVTSTGVIGRHILGETYTDILWDSLDLLDSDRWWTHNRAPWGRTRGELIRRLFTSIGLRVHPSWRLLLASYASGSFQVSAPLVQEGLLSEAPGELKPNYIEWLHDADPTSIQSGLPGTPPTGLLYRVLRHATLLEYANTAFRIKPVSPDTHREPELVDLPDPRQESPVDPGHVLTYWRHLSEARQNDGQTLAAYLYGLRSSGYRTPDVAPLGRFLHSLNVLSKRPTAVLERLLTESFDLGSYRLDAWITSVATARMRSFAGFVAPEVLADKPIAYYRMNEFAGATIAVDSSERGNHGTLSSTGITLGVAGVGGGDSAALFDGLGSGRIVVPDKETLNPKRITMEALISWSGRNEHQQRILEKSFGESADWKTNYSLSIDFHRGEPWRNDTVRVEIATEPGPVVHAVNSTVRVTPHRPTLLAATYDGNMIAIYVNGVLDSSKPASGDISSTFGSSDLGIGNQVERVRPFSGIIDEVALFDKALSAERIQAHGAPHDPTTGIQLGGYGWVENIALEEPSDAARKNAGFVHAPSLAHAATAAILRSGYLSHKEDADGSLLAIDLSSERARLAMDLLDGVRQGQSLGALLGYRFERGLHENPASTTLDQYVTTFRELAPLVARKLTNEPSTEPSTKSLEAIAARNVVDGLALLKRWQAGKAITSGSQWTDATIPFGRRVLPHGPVLPLADLSNPEFKAIDAELALLGDAVDAVSDTLLAESVYQAVQGNPLRAGASLNAISGGDEAPPADLHVLKTPRTGIAVSHRILVLFNGDPPADQDVLWKPYGNGQARASAEPRLNAWAAQLLGDPAKVQCRVQYLTNDGSEISGVETRTVSLKELALSPLDVLYAAPVTDKEQRSDLEQRLAYYSLLTRDKARVPADARARLMFSRSEGWGPQVVTFPEILEVARAARELITRSRAIDARDLLHATARRGAALILTDLADRVDVAKKEFADVTDALDPLPEDVTPLREALLRIASFGIECAVPQTIGETSTDLEVLREQAKRIAEQAKRKLETIRQMPSPSPEDELDHHVSLLQHVFGTSFRVLPRFEGPDEFEKALAVRKERRDAESEMVIPWFQRIAKIREGAARLDTALMYAETIDAGSRVGFDVAQFPLPPSGTPADPWIAGDVVPPGGRLSVAIHAPWPLGQRETAWAGLLIDEWTEVVPSGRETTGLSFHYDAPSACAPQAILLAVPPDVERPWDLETLEAVMLETWEMVKVRAVDPNTLGDVGHFLPPFYFAHNAQNDTISSDFTAS